MFEPIFGHFQEIESFKKEGSNALSCFQRRHRERSQAIEKYFSVKDNAADYSQFVDYRLFAGARHYSILFLFGYA